MAAAAASLCRLRPAAKLVPMKIVSEDDVRAFVKSCVPSLDAVPSGEISVKPLTGGLTNVLYHAWHDASDTHTVVRQYGEGTDALVDRDGEEFWQSAFMMTYGRCQNGLAYEFLKGHESPSLEEFRELHLDNARAIARLHHRAASWGRCALPFANAPEFATSVMLGKFVDIATSAQVRETLTDSESKFAGDERVAPLLEGLPKARDRALAGIRQFQQHLIVGPCHNDINQLNTMVEASTGVIRHIDFEYAQQGFVLYELANHLCEYAGYDAEWSRCLTPEEKRAFVEAYLGESATLCFGSGATVTGSVEAEVAMVEYLELVSSIGWAAWGVAQAAVSSIEYDYIGYSSRRLQRYESTVEAAEEGLRKAKLIID